MPLFHKIHSKTAATLNADLLNDFLQHQDNDDVRKTHLFEGRYENIYLDHRLVPALTSLMAEATALAENISGVKGLRAGYWFNYMPPQAVTLPHTHDDDDELLSAAYYIYVPEKSGELILHNDKERIQLQPEAGDFIFFKPDVIHEVSKNDSTQHRLSIGINFGVDT